MKFRFSLIALLSAVSLPALATSGITPVGGEAGFTTHAMPSAKTRADVIKELEAWRRNPVSADGWLDLGGEAGAVFVGIPGNTRNAANTGRPSRADVGNVPGGLSRSGHQSSTINTPHGHR
ncbi:MAG: DUF4148 domain-containing protein [Piscinibacter sp.]|uniref:DUF4148 domain-containing protein n=1 Tax=Piscinibacter TaxID=1114981 RepID=UPI000FDD39AD|nr:MULTISPECIES: DUF4148 domain-containing protein [Piscinibacter]MCW5663742.1 DUF4148 domain-containing protein [Piscinibacter sp.]